MLQATQSLSKSQKKRLKKKTAASKESENTNGEAHSGIGFGLFCKHSEVCFIDIPLVDLDVVAVKAA